MLHQHLLQSWNRCVVPDDSAAQLIQETSVKPTRRTIHSIPSERPYQLNTPFTKAYTQASVPGSDEKGETYVVSQCILYKLTRIRSSSDIGIQQAQENCQNNQDSVRVGHSRIPQGSSVLQGMFHAMATKS